MFPSAASFMAAGWSLSGSDRGIAVLAVARRCATSDRAGEFDFIPNSFGRAIQSGFVPV